MLIKVLAFELYLSMAWKTRASRGAAIPLNVKWSIIGKQWQVDCLRFKVIQGDCNVI